MGSRGGTTGSNVETITKSDSEGDPAVAAEEVVEVGAAVEVVVEAEEGALADPVVEAVEGVVVEAVVVASEAAIRDADNQTN
jgi:hypothetical protein